MDGKEGNGRRWKEGEGKGRKEKAKEGRKEPFGKVSTTGGRCFWDPKMRCAPCLNLSCDQHRPLPGKFQSRAERCFRDPKKRLAPCLKLSCRQHRPLPGKSVFRSVFETFLSPASPASFKDEMNGVFGTQKCVSPRD